MVGFKLKSILVMGNVTISGFIALFIAWFFAEGALGEADALTPEFFLILPIWVIGVLFLWRFFSKDKLADSSYFKIFLSNFLLWLTIPIGFMLAHQFI